MRTQLRDPRERGVAITATAPRRAAAKGDDARPLEARPGLERAARDAEDPRALAQAEAALPDEAGRPAAGAALAEAQLLLAREPPPGPVRVAPARVDDLDDLGDLRWL
ncbi:MAG: hypothetical protein R3F62_03955 [Planctomycetota bacterium]